MLGSFGGTYTAATALNNLGQVVGYSTSATEETYAFVWDSQQGMRSLGSLDGTYSQGLGINNLGQACGLAMDVDWMQHAVLWNPDSTVTILEAPEGWVDARDLNEAGVVVGHIGNRPVRWTMGGPPQELGHVIDLGWVHAVNASGTACGASDLPANQVYTEAVVWDAGGAFRALGAWTDAGSDALDVNDAGEVVGWAGLIPYAPTSAIYWSPDGTMRDLNLLAPTGWNLLEAVAINARGDIAGVGRDSAGVQQAFVLWTIDPAEASDPSPDQPDATGWTGQDPSQAIRLLLSPNPSSGPVCIRVESGIPRSPARLRVIDVLGRQVDKFDLDSSPTGQIWDAPARLGAHAHGQYMMVLEVARRPVARAKVLLLPGR